MVSLLDIDGLLFLLKPRLSDVAYAVYCRASTRVCTEV